ncbi:DUF2510 domain-containing protein [Leifsonia aquatica]|uniref:DUF2510 domain-containing protein n=1 Tax=Leifsonia aquatica TaxID=144185 RepID=UPI0004A7B65E|nr:DUF2510 domain-containing protein [Leifsonia aquatica]
MTDANGTPGGAAPGWYSDPYGAAPQRWWDGTQWTADVSQPVVPQPAQVHYAPKRPALNPATPVGTVWIWLVVLLPLVTLAMLPFLRFDFTSYFYTTMHASPQNIPDPFVLLGGPMYFVLVLVGWLIWAVTVVLSWLDYRELTRRGVVRPFHWAWSFLSSLVYVIGRTVIVRGVADRRGMAPLWGAIAVTVLSFIVTMIWTVTLLSGMFNDIARLTAYGA